MAETVQHKMLTKGEILALLAQNREKLRQMGVERIGLFGSFARNTPSPNSDVDLLVELKTPSYAAMIELYDFLSILLGAKVDLIRKGPHLKDRFLQAIEKELTYA
ncbi:MAG: nucleotidyltransferase domain-containing protein [Haliscomenobacter sp.]|nr:nucleotidyltransferase domain-containing protein [Haliscomenobacter sp.]MBK7476919.1 nucleotidyltransferase domain-containing protein [Haliscomenobacter sp.]